MEEIARAATPGPNNRGGNGGDKAANGESGAGSKGGDSGSGAKSSSGGSAGGDGGIMDKVMDAINMLGDLVGGAFEAVGGEGDVSIQTLVLGAVIFVLLLSNIYTWRSASSSRAASSQSVRYLNRMQAADANLGYFNDEGYYGPTSPRNRAGDAPIYDRIFAPNVYITPPGGNDATPEAIAKTVTEVVERLYQQNLERFRSTTATSGW